MIPYLCFDLFYLKTQADNFYNIVFRMLLSPHRLKTLNYNSSVRYQNKIGEYQIQYSI